MLSLKRENWFRMYSILFFVLVMLERVFLWEWGLYSLPLALPSFFSYNPIRLLLLFIPFLHESFLLKTTSDKELWQGNVPFLFLGLFALALPSGQIFFFFSFFTGLFFIKGWKVPGFVALVPSAICGGLLIRLGVTDALQESLVINSITVAKVNMHSFQTMVETYAERHHRLYPENTLQLQADAEQAGYWKDIYNPITLKTGHKLSFRDISEMQLRALVGGPYRFAELAPDEALTSEWSLDLLGLRILILPNARVGIPGQVLYYSQTPASYAIYGTYINGKRLIPSGGQPLFLTNS